MRAVGQYIAIEPINEEVKMGIFTLTGEDKNKQRYRRGKILSKGVEVTEVLNVGEIVFYDVVSSFEMLIKDKNVTIIRQRDIVAVED
jgi:co-chaperonin GroES (HSP10)